MTGTSVAIDTVTVEVVVSGVSTHEQNAEAMDGAAVRKLESRSPELVLGLEMVVLDGSAELDDSELDVIALEEVKLDESAELDDSELDVIELEAVVLDTGDTDTIADEYVGFERVWL